MDLKCPKCGSESTQKLTLVMDKGGTGEKVTKMGVSYGANVALPVATVFIAFLVSILFIGNLLVAAIVFAGIIYGGFYLRKKLKAGAKGKYDDLLPAMKQNGFLCTRCENLFIPA
jgi:hypothetical protein